MRESETECESVLSWLERGETSAGQKFGACMCDVVQIGMHAAPGKDRER